MARVALYLDDARNKILLKAILESKGNIVDDEKYDVVITDRGDTAKEFCRDYPVIVLASASQIPYAVSLMKVGIFGYIFLPIQPDEVNIMVERAIVYWKSSERDSGKFEMKTLKEMEFEYIKKVYAECGFCKKETAKRLGIGRNTLWRKLRQVKTEEGRTRQKKN